MTNTLPYIKVNTLSVIKGITKINDVFDFIFNQVWEEYILIKVIKVFPELIRTFTSV